MASIVLLLLLVSTVNGFSVSQLASSASKVLDQSVVAGKTIRECSCEEQSQCLREMKDQADQCMDSCINVFSAVMANPGNIRQCISKVQPTLQNFIGCADKKFESCGSNKQIPYHDIRRMFQVGEQMFAQQKAKIMSQGIVTRMKPVAETLLTYGDCVKNCFVNQKNGNGFCFDRLQCQPNVTSAVLKNVLKSCSRGFNWKVHAGSLCSCGQEAGVVGLENVCPLLRVMG